MKDRPLNNRQLSQENTIVFISKLTKAYRWIKPTNTCADRVPGKEKKDQDVVILKGNSYVL
jgi:hypothetical protein